MAWRAECLQLDERTWEIHGPQQEARKFPGILLALSVVGFMLRRKVEVSNYSLVIVGDFVYLAFFFYGR